MYPFALFLHIVGALLLFALLTIEGFSLRQGVATGRLNRVLGPVSALLILVPGLYMVASTGRWEDWIAVGLTSWILIAIGSAVTGVLMLRGRLNPRAAAVSWSVRTGMALGIVYCMTLKPDFAVAAAAILAGAGAGAALMGVATRRAQAA